MRCWPCWRRRSASNPASGASCERRYRPRAPPLRWQATTLARRKPRAQTRNQPPTKPPRHSAHTALAHLLRSAAAPSFRLQATQAPLRPRDAAQGTRLPLGCPSGGCGALRCATSRRWRPSARGSKQNAYQGRAAMVQVESLDAHSRYAGRGGVAQGRAALKRPPQVRWPGAAVQARLAPCTKADN